MAWLRLPDASFTNGSGTVEVATNTTAGVKVGDSLFVPGYELLEITAVFSTQLEIHDPWAGPTTPNVSVAVIPTAAEFNVAAQLLSDASSTLRDNFASMDQWWTGSGTATFTGFDGQEYTFPTISSLTGLSNAIIWTSGINAITDTDQYIIRVNFAGLPTAEEYFVNHIKADESVSAQTLIRLSDAAQFARIRQGGVWGNFKASITSIDGDGSGGDITIDKYTQAQIDTMMNTLNNSDVALSNAIGQVANDLIATDSRVDGNTTDIATNASNIATNASNIATNVTDIATNVTDIDGLQERELLMTEAQAMQHRAVYKNLFAASGFDHFGKANDASAQINDINEGLFTRELDTSPNSLFMGYDTDTQNVGTSKTGFPVVNIVGFVTSLYTSTSITQNYGNVIRFPDAPNGTVIYDNSGDCRGTGNASLDLTVDIDPKYGDVAADTNEAVARAFEGNIKNGDFRNGVNDWPATPGLSTNIVNGGIQMTGVQGGVRQDIPVTVGIPQNVQVVLQSTTEANTICVVYDGSSFTTILDSNAFDISTTAQVWNTTVTPTQSTIRVYLFINTPSTVAVFGSAFISTATEEVVTERADVFGLEMFLEEITDDEVFPNGCIQNQATTVAGVPTVLSARPDSYFAVFDGQTGINKGRCWKWSTLTMDQKKAVAEHLGANMWLIANGNKVQARIRQRTIAGVGNGDWTNVDANFDHAYVGLTFDGNNRVQARGSSDTIVDYAGDTPYQYRTNNYINRDDRFGLGNFTMNSPQTDIAYNGECYFLVMGTAQRLNQGAYHPRYNPLGVAYMKHNTDYDTNINSYNGTGWFSDTSRKPTTASHCFDGSLGGYSANVSTSNGNGSIGATSGRPDGRFYDTIYAGGQGGVTDLRLSAHDMSSPEEAAKVWEKVKNGTYRGEESLVYTTITSHINGGDPVGGVSSKFLDITSMVPDDWDEDVTNVTVHILDGSNVRTTQLPINSWSPADPNPPNAPDRKSVIDLGDANTFIRKPDMIIVVTYGTGYSVSGEFTTADVIGDPANILLTPDLQNGWLGRWGGITSANVTYDFTRKYISNVGSGVAGSAERQYTQDNGVTWLNNDVGVNQVTNTYTHDVGVGSIAIVAYKAFANQTKESTNKPVLNGNRGVGDVYVNSREVASSGVLLCESLIGKILKGQEPSTDAVTQRISSFRVNGFDAKLDNHASRGIRCTPLTANAPNNNSPAVKVLDYQISNNGQCSLGFHANELTYDVGGTVGNEWGDTVEATTYTNAYGVMKITTSGSSTFTDMNGNTNIQTVHELSLPYGWSKNHARVGTQTDGVDL